MPHATRRRASDTGQGGRGAGGLFGAGRREGVGEAPSGPSGAVSCAVARGYASRVTEYDVTYHQADCMETEI